MDPSAETFCPTVFTSFSHIFVLCNKFKNYIYLCIYIMLALVYLLYIGLSLASSCLWENLTLKIEFEIPIYLLLFKLTFPDMIYYFLSTLPHMIIR